MDTLIQLRRVFSRLNLFCAVIGAVLLSMIASIICVEVVIRWLGGASQLWVIEVSGKRCADHTVTA